MKLFLSLFTIALNAILAENFILVKFLGICPFMGVSKRSSTALGMGIAVIFVMGIASAATWAVNAFVLVPLNLAYMQTLVFILVIAALVQLVEMFRRNLFRPCIRRWAFICPSSPPTAPCLAWRCSTSRTVTVSLNRSSTA